MIWVCVCVGVCDVCVRVCDEHIEVPSLDQSGEPAGSLLVLLRAYLLKRSAATAHWALATLQQGERITQSARCWPGS